MIDTERIRLAEEAHRTRNWQRWGPYLSERQWGTVREDYSPDGSAWAYFPHEHARSRAYRWGEDGLLGICDRECRLCFALALWNGRDVILKERLFGLTSQEGNHGEDVKEIYFYLDSSPTHSYMKALYRYPQAAFPYDQLLEENHRRGRGQPEFEILDTGVFAGGRYFDVIAEYAKDSPNDILIRLTAANRGPEKASLHLLPTLWFRNTWSWGRQGEGYWRKPRISLGGEAALLAEHESLGRFWLEADPPLEFLFTENETNMDRLFHYPSAGPYVKDAFHDYVIAGRKEAVNPAGTGTKAAAHYVLEVPAGESVEVHLRLVAESERKPVDREQVFAERIGETDEFYSHVLPKGEDEAAQRISRQAYAGLLWNKQFYYYGVRQWLEGDPAQPLPPRNRWKGRNREWQHLYNRDVIAMPDKWEYPWYAAWDLAFHTVAFARLDPNFAKQQLVLMLREWYMHPNGQMPAYEFAFSDVNPPVHAWACWRVYKMTAPRGGRDRVFLARVFQKLLINFTWWVNRKDVGGKNIFSGGFLGLDNIGVFDRSQPLRGGGILEQADATAWMAFYCLTMLSIALELARESPEYEDVASKFFEHFVAIADAMNTLGGSGLWDEADGFYYDQLHYDGVNIPLRVRSMVGLLPLIAVEVLDESTMRRLKGFRKRMQWFLENRNDLAWQISYVESHGPDGNDHRLLAIPSRDRLQRVLAYMFDESEFLSPYGLRSLSRFHHEHPFVCQGALENRGVGYEPGESQTELFGGNSNWRGPVWFPVNYLLIEALERYHHFYGEGFRVECPTGSGRMLTLREAARELVWRLTQLFLPGQDGRCPWQGECRNFADDPHWKDLVLFYEYFHGDTGQGLGASHQTGWTALIARCLEDLVKPPG
ncbi:MAG TPA: glucosidase [Bryobacteraceae bacterium]|nr:glucosidase [Bryobacteraceae bacterium]